jgi:hypothetical protein
MNNNPSTKKDINEPGILLRGPDGNLYFVSEKALTAYKLDDDVVCRVEGRGTFDRQIVGIARNHREIGLSASEEPTKTVILDLSAFRREVP